MKILIINQPLNNRGDESAHRALVRALHANLPNVEIRVLFWKCNEDSIRQFNVQLPNVEYINMPNNKSTKYKIWALRLGLKWLWLLHPTLLKGIKLYRWADYVVCAPGGICMGGFQNWVHLVNLHMAKFTHKPLIYYGRSFGPFPTVTRKNRKFKKLSLEIIKYFSFCSIRDAETVKVAKELGCKYETTVDSAFLDSPVAETPQSVNDAIGATPYIVFVPNLLIWHYAYRQYTKEDVIHFYKDIYEILTERYPDHNVVMLPQTFNYGTYLGDDYLFFRDFKAAMGSDRIIVLPDTYSSDIQQEIIKGASCMVGARYHSVVFALNQATPFVALSYEHKIKGLLELLSKTDSMVDITNVFGNKECYEHCISQFEDKLKRISSDTQAREDAKRQAMDCFDKMTDYLKIHGQ